MKFLKVLLICVIFLTASFSSFALTGISYSNFARTNGNNLVTDQDISVTITILDGASIVYKETHAVHTNMFGLFTVKIGSGTPVAPYTLAMYNNYAAANTLNVRADYNGIFVAVSPLLTTALKNEEAAGIVTLENAYSNGNGIEVLAGFPVDLTGTGLIQSSASVAAINTNGNKTLTTKKYVDDAIAALKPLTVNEGLLMTPGPSFNGSTAQVAGIAVSGVTNSKIADGAVDNPKINDNTEFLAVEALSAVGTSGVDTGIYSVTDGARNLKFQGIGLTKITRTGNVIKIDGNDNWGSQVVIHDATLTGNGTTALPLGFDLTHANTWTANQLLPATAAQGNNLVAAENMATAKSLNGDVVNYDATLKVAANKLGLDLAHSNIWVSDQLLNATAAQGNNLIAAENMATAKSLNGDVVNYDATLQVTGNKLGFDLTHPNTWLATQSFQATGSSSVIIDGTNSGATPALLVSGNGDATKSDVNINGEVAITGISATDNNNELVVNGTVKINGVAGDAKYDLVVAGDVAANFGQFVVDNSTNNLPAFGLNAIAYGSQITADPSFPTTAQGLTAQAINYKAYNPSDPLPAIAIGSVGLAQPSALTSSAIAIGNYGGARNSNGVANIGNVGHAWNNAGKAFGTIGLVSQSASPIAEIGAGLSLTAKAGVLGINLGSTADDYAGYFLGKVKATGTIQASQYQGALQYAVTQGSASGIKTFSFNNTAAASVAVDYDATLGITGNQLGLNLNHSNTWGADQLLNATSVQGNNLVAAENMATAKSLNGNVVNYDATLKVSSNALGIDLNNANSWMATQTFATVAINGGTIDATVIGATTPANGTFSTATATTIKGGFTTGSVLFAAAGGAISENNSQLFWDNANGYLGLNNPTPSATLDIYPANPGDVLLLLTGVNDNNPDVVLQGEMLIAGSGADFGLNVNSGGGILLDGGAILKSIIGGTDPGMTNAAILGIASNSDWAGYFAGFAGTSKTPTEIHADSRTNLYITKQYLQQYVFDANPVLWSGLSIFNNPTGGAIRATSGDAATPTVTIENTNSLGVALQLTGASNATTALEITTGNENIANGQLIVSSNTGNTGTEGNGPTLTLNNNGNGVLNENGGAMQVVQGHIALSYKRYTPTNNQDLTSGLTVNDQTYSVYDIVTNGNNKFQLPVTAATGGNYGTLLYIINNGSGVVKITGYADINAGTTATYILTASGWVRLN